MRNTSATVFLLSALTLATLHLPAHAQETSNDTPTPVQEETSSIGTENKPNAGKTNDTPTPAPQESSSVATENKPNGTTADGAPQTILIESEVPIEIDESTGDGRHYPDHVLREVHPKHRARDVGITVVGALLGGYRLPAFSNNDYAGEKIAAVKHPATSGLTEGLRATIRHWQQEHRKQNAVYKNPFTIRLVKFALLYRDMFAETTTYDLYIETTVTRKPDGSSWFSSPERILCSTEDTDRHFTLDQWTANDYERVKAFGRDHVKSCIAQVESSLDKLLKD